MIKNNILMLNDVKKQYNDLMGVISGIFIANSSSVLESDKLRAILLSNSSIIVKEFFHPIKLTDKENLSILEILEIATKNCIEQLDDNIEFSNLDKITKVINIYNEIIVNNPLIDDDIKLNFILRPMEDTIIYLKTINIYNKTVLSDYIDNLKNIIPLINDYGKKINGLKNNYKTILKQLKICLKYTNDKLKTLENAENELKKETIIDYSKPINFIKQ